MVDLESESDLPSHTYWTIKMTQCEHEVLIALTTLKYKCLLQEGHDGPHRIGISNEFECDDFNIIDEDHQST
jgi:hypothetical protein